MKYICPVCGYVYDEAKEGTAFMDLPSSWICPLCGVSKSLFTVQEEMKEEVKVDEAEDEELEELGTMELSVLSSNLARGLEKQYQFKEAELFRELADYFKASSPKIEAASIQMLSSLLKKDLAIKYPALLRMAQDQKDRGMQRVCVWGTKVTQVLDNLLERYIKEGPDFLKGKKIFVCSVCGFTFVGAEAPKLCPVCKVPDWKFDEVN